MKQNSSASLIHQLSFSGENRKALFLDLPEEKRAHVLLRLSRHTQAKLLTAVPEKILLETFEHLDPDEITDLIQLLPSRKQKKLIRKFSTDLKKSVEFLQQFDPKSAAGLMSLDYIQVDVEENIAAVAKQFKVHEKRTGRFPVILVMTEGKLKGVLPGYKLGTIPSAEEAGKHCKKILSVRHNADQDEVLQVFRDHPHDKIAVLGNRGNVIGVIYSDDVLKILREETAASLYDFAGVSDEENVTDSARQKVKHRYKWLIINLATAFMAAFTVGLFEEVIAQYVLLAVYMPIVAGMGGNAGTQTLAVLVRGIALNQIDLKTAWPTLKREITAGVVNGIINGLLVAGVVITVNQDFKIAFILGLAMILNLLIAGFFGTLVPLIMKKLGKDPAASATVFITTATDVLGFMAFLGLATVILS